MCVHEGMAAQEISLYVLPGEGKQSILLYLMTHSRLAKLRKGKHWDTRILFH